MHYNYTGQQAACCAVECREEAPCVWINLTSSRIWRGSNAPRDWRYTSKGAWKPRAGCSKKQDKGGKVKGKLRKRKLADDQQGMLFSCIFHTLYDKIWCPVGGYHVAAKAVRREYLPPNQLSPAQPSLVHNIWKS